MGVVVTMAVAKAVPGVIMVDSTEVVIMVVVGRVPAVIMVVGRVAFNNAKAAVIMAVGMVALFNTLTITGPAKAWAWAKAWAKGLFIDPLPDTREPKDTTEKEDTDTRVRKGMVDMDTKERKGMEEQSEKVLEKVWEADTEKADTEDTEVVIIVVI